MWRLTLHELSSKWPYYASWDSLHDHLKDVPWEDIFKPSASAAAAAASDFCEWVHFGIDVYIPHRK